MHLIPVLVDFVFFTGVALLWAKWSKLDLGLRAPGLGGAWPWILLFVAWVVAEWRIVAAYPINVDPAWLERMAQLSLFEQLTLATVLIPFYEELLFRGAMFSALLRRWGIWAAAVVPSLLWALLHLQYEWWIVASLFGSGVVLAMIRWKSGSLYPPLVLHAASNLIAMLDLSASG